MRGQLLIWTLSLSLIAAITGCNRSGNGGRAEPAGGYNEAPVSYQVETPNAIVHTLQGETVADLIEQPETLTGFEKVAPVSVHRVQGRLTELKSGVLMVHCFEDHPTLGQVIQDETNAKLVKDGDGYRFQGEFKAPRKPGRYTVELVYTEFDLTDPENVTNHVLATTECVVSQ
ncbi:MAG: hypothetical protein KDA69_09755 [Planctomycetaceae bacterium]|nr:hypothetical protein [Planctomycetaceae bacterium]MCA9044593.1 hypothetical protein [Planctomycetaceae bacterium]MCB9952540.1 hypothetical protein [Planctomycetaceae bacterium]